MEVFLYILQALVLVGVVYGVYRILAGKGHKATTVFAIFAGLVLGFFALGVPVQHEKQVFKGEYMAVKTTHQKGETKGQVTLYMKDKSQKTFDNVDLVEVNDSHLESKNTVPRRDSNLYRIERGTKILGIEIPVSNRANWQQYRLITTNEVQN